MRRSGDHCRDYAPPIGRAAGSNPGRQGFFRGGVPVVATPEPGRGCLVVATNRASCRCKRQRSAQCPLGEEVRERADALGEHDRKEVTRCLSYGLSRSSVTTQRPSSEAGFSKVERLIPTCPFRNLDRTDGSTPVRRASSLIGSPEALMASLTTSDAGSGFGFRIVCGLLSGSPGPRAALLRAEALPVHLVSDLCPSPGRAGGVRQGRGSSDAYGSDPVEGRPFGPWRDLEKTLWKNRPDGGWKRSADEATNPLR